MTFLLLAIYSLAVFRLATFLSDDSGPYAVFTRLRSFLKREAKTNKPLRDSKLHIGVACLRCEALWMAIPIGLYATYRPMLPGWFNSGSDLVILVLALSSAAILLHRMFPKR